MRVKVVRKHAPVRQPMPGHWRRFNQPWTRLLKLNVCTNLVRCWRAEFDSRHVSTHLPLDTFPTQTDRVVLQMTPFERLLGVLLWFGCSSSSGILWPLGDLPVFTCRFRSRRAEGNVPVARFVASPVVCAEVGLYCRDGAVRGKRLFERKQHLCSTCGSYSETFWGRCTGQVELRVRLSPESS